MDATDTADPGFLSRNVVPGNPDANTMHTNINMGGNRIANLNVATAGVACAAGVNNGEIATGSRNEVLVCNAGTWERQGMAYMGGTVTHFSNLPPCNASNMGETRRVSSISGMFVCSGIRWDAALNESNNLVLPQHLQVAGNAVISGTATVGSHASIGGNASVAGSATVYGNASIAGNASVSGRLTSTDIVTQRIYDSNNTSYYVDPASVSRLNYANIDGAQINAIETENSACSPNGRIARTNSGLILSCQSGKWRAQSVSSETRTFKFTERENSPSGDLSTGTTRNTVVLGDSDDFSLCTVSSIFFNQISRDRTGGILCQIDLKGGNWVGLYGANDSDIECQYTCFKKK